MAATSDAAVSNDCTRRQARLKRQHGDEVRRPDSEAGRDGGDD
jgi:hypothetical protein